ncbi:malonate transporter [Ancylobacter sp. 3268]|uniref:AEC family transporter n=1 Tax=Ancylobacter sp. 3268 TaxID=2817752 RepID=UPI002864E0EA|nr:AEC family transporter [Ancylobacter sp. 3268]MDR6955524.1 malonate transporter [Ancylobacter sp. 3268]
MIGVILQALAPIFFVIAIGYAAGARQRIDNQKVNSLNALVMEFALPASIFVAMASAPAAELLNQLPLFFIFSGLMLVIFFAWYVFARHCWTTDPADAAMQALTIAFPNLAGVGLPIAGAVLGPDGTVPVAVLLAAGSLTVSPLGLLIAEMSASQADGTPNGARIIHSLKRAVSKPIVIAPLLGVLLSLFGIGIDNIVRESLMLLGQGAASVALFLTGLVLSSQPFTLDRRIVGATLTADVVRPLLAAGAVLLLPVANDVAKTIVLLATIPSGFFGILFAVNYRLNSGVLGSMVLASTLVSAITTGAVIALLY